MREEAPSHLPTLIAGEVVWMDHLELVHQVFSVNGEAVGKE